MMINQLKELLEMQRTLDADIFKKRGIEIYPLNNMKLALLVELGELMNEFPTQFKHWKQSPRDNREKGLIEYVDCLHFMLSLANYHKINIDSSFEYDKFKFHFLKNESPYPIIRCCIEDSDSSTGLWALFMLGNKLGFTWDEIYKSYKEKNEVNYERLKNGY